MKKKFEYCSTFMESKDSVALSDLGNQGWEMCGVIGVVGHREGLFFFKREKPITPDESAASATRSTNETSTQTPNQ